MVLPGVWRGRELVCLVLFAGFIYLVEKRRPPERTAIPSSWTNLERIPAWERSSVCKLT
jgi:hypothetical protein